jgi:hypothetical protein
MRKVKAEKEKESEKENIKGEDIQKEKWIQIRQKGLREKEG